ncbi:UDP-glucose--hexose-1-phosphate uridylyltransferase [Anaerocolumna sedimenticola]|uniref:Galactose-1-phosphate uridylyltransferase n=1 Tax=Anaerocolumna sedimenticola TaxID=2696063 RepID=A0A6P1TN86_9FIRM|nr:UDP-glucose--hexose-1-phosphate uridylyltransferase [Anaerocolumna sedimenticola]QHQ61787.1 UDP-glucose--hexose-1-phosphate uridylyltransferase [Anaerocolumna sedimenticola]
MINQYITALVSYGLKKGLIEEQDKIYTINRFLELFGLEEFKEPAASEELTMSLEQILNGMLDYAYEQGIIKENSIVYRDLFDTKIMGVLVPKPSEVIKKFQSYYKDNPKKATDFYYQFSQDTDYIRRYRITKDIKWVTKTEYGDIDITINLSKPEKDPKAIAAAKLMKQSGYPKCLLCKENEGYSGRVNHPARQNHRIIPVQIFNQKWGFQYSPYVYYNEHCIVFNGEHTPMKIDRAAFGKLFDFVKQFPHYFVGSNADLPIVGGSILTHDHFQGGNYEFAMAKAPIEKYFTMKGYEKVRAGIVKWPMSVIRLQAEKAETLIELGDSILGCWRNYTDEASFIYAYSDSDGTLLTAEKAAERTISDKLKLEPHNTITPIARKVGNFFELDLVLRNNVTTNEHPFGVYHPHDELHHIKKENIGLIEVMGLAVLPSRLKEEMEILKSYILSGKDINSNKMISKHKNWVDEFLPKYQNISENNIDHIIQDEIGLVFSKVLEHAGVYKRNGEGQEAFLRFINYLNESYMK